MNARSDSLKHSKKKKCFYHFCKNGGKKILEGKKMSLGWSFHCFIDYLLRYETNKNMGGRNTHATH